MIPMQDKCDPNDPEEAALWAVVGIEATPGVPMLVPEDALRSLSKQLVNAGFRHHPELQTHKAVIEGAPDVDGVNWMGVGSVRWVPVEYDETASRSALEAETPTATVSDAALDSMSGQEIIDLANKLRARGVIGEPAPVEPDPVTVSRLGDLP